MSPKHPLEHAFPKDSLVAKVVVPTGEKKARGGMKAPEATAGDIDLALKTLINAVKKTTESLDEEGGKKRVRDLLIAWNDVLIRRKETPLFISLDKATTLQEKEVRIAWESAQRDPNDADIKAEARQRAEATVSAQETSLAEWVWYITRPQHRFSNSYIALVFKSLARENNSINPYPAPHSEVLSRLSEVYKPYLQVPSVSSEDETRRKLKGFSNAYTEAVAKSDAELAKLREGSDVGSGKWEEFTGSARHISRIMQLCKNTPLCLKDKRWAEFYTSEGRKLRLFLTSPASAGKPALHSIPRIALCYTQEKDGKHIYEMRGVHGARQELESIPALTDEAQKEANEYENGAGYVKRARDIRDLIKLENKIQKNKLDKRDLERVYELHERFETFGRGSGRQRVEGLRKGRDPIKDAEILFGTIATSVPDLKAKLHALKSGEKIGAYIGLLPYDEHNEDEARGFWNMLAQYGIEHIYNTTFPEGKITRRGNTLSPTTPDEIRTGFNNKVSIVGYADDMIDQISAEDLQNAESFPTYTLRVRDLFTEKELRQFGSRLPATKDIFGSEDDIDKDDNPAPFTKGAMTRRGLDFCPATLASRILLEEADTEKPDTLAPGEWETIAMKPIPGRDGRPNVFSIVRSGGGELRLGGWAVPDYGWSLDARVVFRPRK